MTLADNLSRAETLLQQVGSAPILNHIAGAAVPAESGKTFETVSPVDMRRIADVARGNAADIDRAARAATQAFAEWRDLAGAKRKAILHRIADGIVARADDIALLECMDTGQALRFMSKAALRAAENFRFFADLAPTARNGKSLFAPDQMNVTSRSRSGRWGLSRPGTRRSCCPAGRSHRRWRRDALLFTSRPNCPR